MADFAIVTFCLSTATTWNRTRSTPIPSFHHRCVPPFSSAAGVGATRPAAVTLAVAVGHGAVRCTAATPGFDVFAPSDTPAITSAASGSAHDQLSNPLSTKANQQDRGQIRDFDPSRAGHGVDEGDPALGGEHGVAQCDAGAGLASRPRDHHA